MNAQKLLAQIKFKSLKEEWIDGVVELVREGLHNDIERLLSIYGSQKIGEYIKDSLEEEENSYLCAFLGNEVVGFMHMRRWDEYWHVNELSVAKGYRGQGIGGAFLDIAQEEAHRRGFKKMSLTVASENKALNLYLRNGYIEIDSHDYVEHKACGSDIDDITLEDLEHSEAEQELYGLSYLWVRHEGVLHKAGRIGNGTYRIDEEFPVAVMDFLLSIDSARRLFYRKDKGSGDKVMTLLKMEKDLKD